MPLKHSFRVLMARKRVQLALIRSRTLNRRLTTFQACQVPKWPRNIETIFERVQCCYSPEIKRPKLPFCGLLRWRRELALINGLQKNTSKPSQALAIMDFGLFDFRVELFLLVILLTAILVRQFTRRISEARVATRFLDTKSQFEMDLKDVTTTKAHAITEFITVADGTVDLEACFHPERDLARQTLLSGTLQVPVETANSLDLFILSAAEKHCNLMRKSPFWMVPSIDPVDERLSAFLIARTSRAVVVVVPLAVCGTMTLLTSKGVSDDSLKVGLKVTEIGEPGASDLESTLLVYAADSSISVQQACFEAVKAAERALAKLGLKPVFEEPETDNSSADHRNSKTWRNETWLDTLGWCSWNAYYQSVSAEGVQKSVSELVQQHNIQLGWIILDDGYEQITEDVRLIDFPADPTTFPDGLAGLTNFLRTQGIQKIGIWHTMQGYWDGIDPDTLGKRYPSLQLFDETWLPTSRKDVFALFRDLHEYMESQGIDFYKVDNQGSMERVPMPLWELFHEALAASTRNTDVIYCMAMGPMTFSKSLVGRSAADQRRNLRLLRNSDDYFPDDLKSHGTHLYANTLNNLYAAQLSLDISNLFSGIPTDWDEFQSHKPRASFHAASRALHNGPVYLADEPGVTDVPLVRALIVGEEKEGTWKGAKVLRPLLPAIPVGEACVFRDPRQPGGPLLKIGNTNTFPVKTPQGTFISASFTVGMFNCRDPDGERVSGAATLLEAQTSMSWRIPGYTRDTGAHAAFIYTTHFARIVGPDVEIPVTLIPGQWELVSFNPRFGITKDDSEIIVSCLGYPEKYNGAAAVTKVEMNGSSCTYSLRHRAVVSFVALGSDEDLRRLQITVNGARNQVEMIERVGTEGYVMLRVDARREGKESLEPCEVVVSIGDQP